MTNPAPRTHGREKAPDASSLARAFEDRAFAERAAQSGLTVADASAASGLALRDAEQALKSLVATYGGHLRATEKGELLYLFPRGLTRLQGEKSLGSRIAGGVWSFAKAATRFIVRAWVAVVLVGYVAIFIALFIALAFAGRSDSNREMPGGRVLANLVSVIVDAMYWTFHPFSPVYIAMDSSPWGARARQSPTQRQAHALERPKVPFYERVNRYFFGPKEPLPPPGEDARRIVQEIRAQRGRIGLADVMRVTGMRREDADPLMAQLMLDYDGDVHVSEEGGITYSFPSLRLTADDHAPVDRAPSAWSRAPEVSPLTGNGAGTNFLITALNAFNLISSAGMIASGLTLEGIFFMFTRHAPDAVAPLPGTPLVLGWIPFVFSIALFALPIARAAFRPFQAKKAANERGRLALVKAIVEAVQSKKAVTERVLRDAYAKAAGRAPESKEITREVVALGGDVDLDRVRVDAGAKEGDEIRYRFVDLETEARALEEERAHASEEEAKPGRVVFASDS